jgi:hypothetical protein
MFVFKALTLSALFSPLANGTTLARLSFEELAQKSTAIARLRCVGVETKWGANEIWTETRFEVLERYKGILSEKVTVRMLGGTLGNLHSRVEGVPVFHSGEEVYAFLWARDGEPYRVLGWSQGTFRISLDSHTRIEKVTQDSAAMLVYQSDTRRFVRSGIRALPVADFREKLKQALAAKTP